MSSSKELHFSGPFRHQQWSFPNSLIFHMAKNPSSSEAYQKLIQTCKYFFTKKSIIVVEQLTYTYVPQNWLAFCGKTGKEIDFANTSMNIWILSEISCIQFNNKNLVSSIILKFYRIDVKNSTLYHQIISLKEFLIITSSVEDIILEGTIVKNEEDNSAVPLENLLKALSKIQKFYYCVAANDTSITANTEFELREIPEQFDIKTFFTYAKYYWDNGFGGPRTTNGCEGFHSKLNVTIPETRKPQYVESESRIIAARQSMLQILQLQAPIPFDVMLKYCRHQTYNSCPTFDPAHADAQPPLPLPPNHPPLLLPQLPNPLANPRPRNQQQYPQQFRPLNLPHLRFPQLVNPRGHGMIQNQRFNIPRNHQRFMNVQQPQLRPRMP